jgi:phenylalanine-4-hydroxylase
MKVTNYSAKTIKGDGTIAWSAAENAIWRDLYARQHHLIQDKACDAYLHGLKLLDLPTTKVPQLKDVDEVLLETTGWRTAPVPCLINFDKFFTLLANRQFPVATFIRCRDEFDYLQEPDIFHEIYGHCPLLTNPAFAHFTHTYGQLGLHASKEERVYLARLYWFTVEFGLVQRSAKNADNLAIYGGGILSSPSETEFAYSSQKAERLPFDLATVLRTPYRIDQLQPRYYIIEHLDALFELAERDLLAEVHKAMALGLHSLEALTD